jgi:hypothetical protein
MAGTRLRSPTARLRHAQPTVVISLDVICWISLSSSSVSIIFPRVRSKFNEKRSKKKANQA